MEHAEVWDLIKESWSSMLQAKETKEGPQEVGETVQTRHERREDNNYRNHSEPGEETRMQPIRVKRSRGPKEGAGQN